MAKKIIVGNWKENPGTLEEARRIFKQIRGACVVCPPNIFIPVLGNAGKIKLGAQDCSSFKEGAYTGEVSAQMIKSAGADYVILGHSERREMGELDEIINKKVTLALKSGLKVIFCIGEKTRDSAGHYLNSVRDQINIGLQGVQRSKIKNIVVAYEPRWAISSHHLGPASPADAHEMSIFIRRELARYVGAKAAISQMVIYGGSVDHKNAGEFLKEKNINGLLVGRASLNPKSFNEILKVAQQI